MAILSDKRTPNSIADAIFPESANVFDQFSTSQPDGVKQALQNGVILVAGQIRVTDMLSDLNVSMTAVFYQGDVSQYPGTPTGPVQVTIGGKIYYQWQFDWADVPAIGDNTLLQFTELTSGGEVLNYYVNIIS